ncbi:hypothetical protein G4V62_02605 [Bacillaceae bacterium SIJ1]|uniref:hypothetical protein n=1 Tax=Litoribacterium kuwaitense TaxID=1398745 RepID=UPI0013EC2FE7|nr:hypothetical protein [Litoribacterium kuwaitense]NGP43891.1 hypothetical protein [Litoribacterium kuwaitense]
MGKEREDLPYEGRAEAFIDVDRMLSEGMAASTIGKGQPTAQVDEARDLPPESPPRQTNKEKKEK